MDEIALISCPNRLYGEKVGIKMVKILINTHDVKETLFREEKELAKMLFNTKEYPIEFITGVQDSMNIANTVYHSTSDIESAIKELQDRIKNMGDTIIKCGYWFILSYLHYMNDDVILSVIASGCVKGCYRTVVSDNG